VHKAIREIEAERDRPIGILADLQGPKLRVGVFANGEEELEVGQQFRVDMDDAPGTKDRVQLPHPEIFAAVEDGANLLVNDGKIHLRVLSHGETHAVTEVLVGGTISNRKGVNVPDMYLPISPLTEKDRVDLKYALSLGVDWVAMSFVQRPEDMVELRGLVDGQAAIMAKMEKPSAINHLADIIDLSDGIMVARGDLGVEMPQEKVPVVQKK